MTALLRNRKYRPLIVVVAAIIIGGGLFLALRGGGKSTTTAVRAPASAETLTSLRSAATASTSPMYWIGAQTGVTYELTKTSDGRVFIRYLPAGVAAGSTQAYLTIGTYPVPNAYDVTQKLAVKSSSVKVAVKNGVAFYNSGSPTNVYLAFPNSNYQIEVYNPDAAQAQSIVASGKIVPVVAGKATGSTTTRATAAKATPATLKAAAKAVKHTIYWSGAADGKTLELSKTANGSVYLRYLPAGVAVGSTTAYTTIGSYPVKNAFAAVKALSKKAGAVILKVPGSGAVAFYSASRPTNVYLAYPGTDVEIEVYDPNASHAHDLVSSRSIVPVP